jgi:hypothetical protein
MNQVNLKTLVPAVVGAGVLVYEAVTGHKVEASVQAQMVNDVLVVAGIVVTVWGIFKNHKKDVQK